MMNLYSDLASAPKTNAQRNLSGRTHYVDDQTLRWHKARILSSQCVCNGLLFALIESVATVHDGSKRGFRFVIFDLFGNTVIRQPLNDCWRSRASASRAMWRALNDVDAILITEIAIKQEEKYNADQMQILRETVNDIRECNKANARTA